MIYKADFLIIGSGIAGLTFALKAAERYPEKKIMVVTKSEALESNTRYAQGGIAAVWDAKKDTFQKHIKDTMAAGDFINDPEIVDIVVKEASERLNEIIAWGVEFDKDASGSYELGLEGGHSENRILHHKDITGFEIEKNLLQRIHSTKNITLLIHHFSVDLIVQENECVGAHLINLNTLSALSIFAKVTLLATGGIGQVYSNTTNPTIATGDGIAMAIRAGALIRDMEFIQFHPTALFQQRENPSFLISEAVRGLGATLKNKDGKEFMHAYSSQGSLAPRDIVSRAIALELKKSGEACVYLDCTMIEEKNFIHHFPNIYQKCKDVGIDISKDRIPVVPAAHYLCGGIKTNQWGETSIEGLYACGECACTGLHGANRLASNSLLEALVFAHRCFLDAANKVDRINFPEVMEEVPNRKYFLKNPHTTKTIKKKINDIATRNLGILRDHSSLRDALSQLQSIQKELAIKLNRHIYPWQFLEVHNVLTVAIEITQASLNRTENKGLFYSMDNELSNLTAP